MPPRLEGITQTSPLLLQSTLPIPTRPGFFLTTPLTLNLRTPMRRRPKNWSPYYDRATPHTSFPTQKEINKNILENFFLTKAHVAVNRVTLSIYSTKEEEAPMKIRSFLSLQIDQIITKKSISKENAHPLEVSSQLRPHHIFHSLQTTPSKTTSTN